MDGYSWTNDFFLSLAYCGNRLKDGDPKRPPSMPPSPDLMRASFDESRLVSPPSSEARANVVSEHMAEMLEDFAAALAREYIGLHEGAVSRWYEDNGATPAALRTDRFYSWCAHTVEPAVRSKQVTLAELCAEWKVPCPGLVAASDRGTEISGIFQGRTRWSIMEDEEERERLELEGEGKGCLIS